MVISDENSFPILIDSIDVPTLIKHFWVLKLSQDGEPFIDFTLQELAMFEEHVTPSLEFRIDGYRIEAPTNWNILVYSEETAQVDVAEISDLTRSKFTALIYQHRTGKIIPGPIMVVDYHIEAHIKTPALNKHTMLCHHVGPDGWICLAPTDNYNKYLKNVLIGDLMY
jgi:hypothetical protein